MVFDIDETVLSTFAHMREQDFGYVPAVWNQEVARGEFPALEPMQRVYRAATERSVDVFFVTGRSEPRDRAGTEANLRRAGFSEYVRLVLTGGGDHGSSAQRKQAARAALEAEGWTIIANLGDQESDLAGGHAERAFKLPNPFYRVD